MDNTHFRIHILRIILPVDIAVRRIRLVLQRRVAHLRRQAVLEVKQARLAHVLKLRARLADDSRLEACTGAGVPAENRERASAGTTGTTVFLLRLDEEV